MCVCVYARACVRGCKQARGFPTAFPTAYRGGLGSNIPLSHDLRFLWTRAQFNPYHTDVGPVTAYKIHKEFTEIKEDLIGAKSAAFKAAQAAKEAKEKAKKMKLSHALSVDRAAMAGAARSHVKTALFGKAVGKAGLKRETLNRAANLKNATKPGANLLKPVSTDDLTLGTKRGSFSTSTEPTSPKTGRFGFGKFKVPSRSLSFSVSLALSGSAFLSISTSLFLSPPPWRVCVYVCMCEDPL